VDLPTYTSIWRIEKRLYKLYDFRLPMPLPIGRLTIFVVIAVPYVVLLTLVGVPFNHTLVWMYILPPGAATWLVSRPVLESKRLPELVRSQLRYLAEPRILCRMAPLVERDVVAVTGKVWRPRASRRWPEAEQEAEESAQRAEHARRLTTPMNVALVAESAHRLHIHLTEPSADTPARPHETLVPAVPAATPDARPVWPSAPARARGAGVAWPASGLDARQGAGQGAAPGNRAAQKLVAAGRSAEPQPPKSATEPGEQAPEPAPAPAQGQEPSVPARRRESPASAGRREPPASAGRREPSLPAALGPPASPVQPRPVITVVGADRARSAPPAVERALAGPSARLADRRTGPVSVVPGGHRPGKPDALQRDRSRVQLPIDFSARIIVLGCTVGAGQTMTALLVGEVLASLRADRVAVLDLNPGIGSVTRRAEARPALSHAALARSSRLIVIGPQPEPGVATDEAAGPAEPLPDPAAIAARFETAARQHDLVIADPGTAAMPRLLAIADQLILVAPASAAAPGAIAMTFEWLEAHGLHDLAAGSIMVLNGVSRRSVTHVEQAERVCAGRCRAIVRVPWDDQLQKRAAKRTAPPTPAALAGQQWVGVLNLATAGAYTALAGVLVASLHDRGRGEEQCREPAGRARP
jgi:MinD-like ATPase involved in chromosome partitioning or flagellar assembly